MRLISCRFLLTSVSIAGLFTGNLLASNKSEVASRDSIQKDYDTLESNFHYELNDNQGVAVKSFNEIRSLGVSGSGLASFQMTFNAKELTVTYQLSSAESERQFKSSLEGVTELKFIRRSGMLCLYLATEEGSYPFIGLDCGFSESLGLEIQSSTAAREQSNLSQRFDSPPTAALKHHFNERALGVEFTGEWNFENTVLHGGVWLSDPSSKTASATCAIQGALQGEHEIWIHNPSVSANTQSALVRVTNAAEVEEVELDLSQAQGLWIGVGRYEVKTASGILGVTVSNSETNDGSIALDRLNCVWSNWKDENDDGIPDILSSNDLRFGSDRDLWDSMLVASDFERNKGLVIDKDSKGPESFEGYPVDPITGEVHYFADSELGDDMNDGASPQVEMGSWVGQRSGPKKTLTGISQLTQQTRPVVLNLKGQFDASILSEQVFFTSLSINGGVLGGLQNNE